MREGALGQIILAGEHLPSDVQVQSYDAHEAISLPYVVDVAFSTRDPAFRVDACLQRRVLLQVVDGRGGIRYYDGLPDRAGLLAYRSGDFVFHLRLRPALAALEHREGSRIFQDKSPVDVVKAVLSEAGVDEDVEWRLRQTYAPREFLCQYHEREIDFVHRLLEEEGIFYFFSHGAEGHKLVFADAPEAFVGEDGAEPVLLSRRKGLGAGAQPLVALHRKKTLRPTEIELRDYDFEKPDVFPTAAVPAPGPIPLRHFEYPGGFVAGAEGSRKANRRLSALRGDTDVCQGKSRAAGLVCGAPMMVEGAREPFLNGAFVVTELRARGRQGGDASENEFTAIPKGAPFAAPKRTKKPRIRGVQTAVVTGPSNEAQGVHVDKYGRVKVRFLWDRSGKQDDTSSVWLRVSQLGLGGSMVLPRVGWEVSVGFVDGDPDRPLVLGRAYNAENTPPYALPGAAADSSLKSMSTPGGAGHNEIKMGDTAGGQGMSIAAKKDLNVTTGNDKNETVGVDETHSVGSNYAVSVGANEATSVGANQSIDVGNALQIKVKGDQTTSVGGNDQFHAKADFVEKVDGTRDYTVGGNQITISCGVRQQITGAFTREVGSIQANVSLASIDDNMLSTYDEKASLAIVHLVAGTSVESVATSKDHTNLAGELHMVGAISTEAKGVKNFIGGVHLRNVAGDYIVQAPTIVLGGGVGKFNGGGSSIKLNGGPVTLKGSQISIKAVGIVKQAASLKIG
ncbi:type VI secretion system tip protein TssI/VgrG [Polyangium sp. 15x6]|uniref:type VI secretion system Vgr family protein n=1 Tax=Polyangium sp. 15x6 TaxID=3042687 RepID=UPI00249B6633|nr:type VI secretion system tip protein TssI/VgrG [Polyangium sp. 15x6]MDI3284256.1 type VI secretion system tip protein TssI/VgrG [Polyangium sp. 15x6]